MMAIQVENINKVDWCEDHYQLLSELRRQQGLSFLEEISEKGMQQFRRLGIPRSNLEEWKYTNLRLLERTSFGLADEDTGSVDDLLSNCRLLPDKEVSARLIFLNGRLIPQQSLLKGYERGLRAVSLQEFFKNPSLDDLEKFKRLFGSLASVSDFGLVALNSSMIGDGALIDVAKESRIAKPVELVYLSDGKMPFAANNRILVNLSEGAELNIIERNFSSTTELYYNNLVSEYFFEQESRLEHVKVIEEGCNAFYTSNTFATQADSSEISFNVFSFSGSTVRNEYHFSSAGEQSISKINGLSLLNDKGHVDNVTEMEHQAPNTESSQIFKGIYSGESSGVFSGTVIVQPEAQKTNAYQSNQSVLLSEAASVETRPQLKIWADDVRCSHGATVGQLDEEALFYLRSRGLSEDVARGLLLKAFAEEVVSQVTSANLQEILATRVEKALN